MDKKELQRRIKLNVEAMMTTGNHISMAIADDDVVFTQDEINLLLSQGRSLLAMVKEAEILGYELSSI